LEAVVQGGFIVIATDWEHKPGGQARDKPQLFEQRFAL
jgi:hypothetical protein